MPNPPSGPSLSSSSSRASRSKSPSRSTLHSFPDAATSGQATPSRTSPIPPTDRASSVSTTKEKLLPRSASPTANPSAPSLPARGKPTDDGSLSKENTKGDAESALHMDRMREAMNARLQFHTQRGRFAHTAGAEPSPTVQDKRRTRVSPIAEESKLSPSIESAFLSTPLTGSNADSSDSTKTVVGSAWPSTASSTIRTPSYPFPAMNTPRPPSAGFHRPFTALSPTIPPAPNTPMTYDSIKDRLASGSVTPASTATFFPAGSTGTGQREPSDYPSPNLYEATLMLGSEPGLDAWWTAAVRLMQTSYRAERATLAVPADQTDPDNVPWGQKATFNAAYEDHDSLVYLQQGSVDPPSDGSERSTGDWSESLPGEEPLTPQPKVRPALESRHSFAGFGVTTDSAAARVPSGVSQRPGVRRAESYVPGSRPTPRPGEARKPQLNSEALEHNAAFEDPKPVTYADLIGIAERENCGRVVPILQALDYEPEALIDSGGVTRVLDRGKAVVLSRHYNQPHKREAPPPALSPEIHPTSAQVAQTDVRGKASLKAMPQDLLGRSSAAQRAKGSLLGRKGLRDVSAETTSDPPSGNVGSGDVASTRPPVGFEEFEQPPASPWSQSPAPSPAIASDPSENPFFVSAKVDEDSFNPTDSTHDYSSQQQVEAIGMDRASTVIHIPLFHPLLSRSIHPSRFDQVTPRQVPPAAGAATSKPPSTKEAENTAASGGGGDKVTPIAILSLLCPLIPYPSNLLRSLSQLAPHLATTFSLARQYSKVESQAAGLLTRRVRPLDLQGLDVEKSRGQSLEDLVHLDVAMSPSTEEDPPRSTSGSMTSPSDLAGLAKISPNGSPATTPIWDPAITGFPAERKAGGNTPGLSHVEGATRYLPINPAENQRPRRPTSGAVKGHTPGTSEEPRSEIDQMTRSPTSASFGQHLVQEPGPLTSRQTERLDAAAQSQETVRGSSPNEASASGRPLEHRPSSRKHAKVQSSGHGSQGGHTLLHSYGADFNATFQSLPSGATTVSRTPRPIGRHSRTASETAPPLYDMPPPSERLLRTVVDSIPVQIFTAAPQSGAITWVNSRFLTYRGQSVEDFLSDPWQSIHPDQRAEYLETWRQSLRNGEQFSYQVRIRRFDGNYRWFYVRAAPLRDTRGVTVHWFGTNMDIHEQHIAEVNAARQKETAASEAKYRSLANSSPQIVFAATDTDGITFANTQWLAYSGQKFEDALGLGFMEQVHPEDLPKCKLPVLAESPNETPNVPVSLPSRPTRMPSTTSSTDRSEPTSSTGTDETVTAGERFTSRVSSGASKTMDLPVPELSELAKTGILRVTRDANGRPAYATEVRLRAADGTYRWHLVRCIMVDSINFGNGEGSWYGTCTDINDHKLLEQKLKETMDSKTRFLSNMSHEIRTPLIGISGMVQFLFDTSLDAEQTDYCNTIRSSSDGLISVVNDILDLSKIEAGMMSLSSEWFHIRSMIESVNDAVSSVAINKRLELNYVVEEDVPAMVKGDRARVRQILMNVLGNAVKFTTEGEVFAHCQVHKDHDVSLAEDEVMLSFEVIDSGKGFSQREAELIFKPFSQIDGSSTRQHGGSGLGLVISRQLVELHGGEMTGTSEPGKGSTFRFFAKFMTPSESDHPEADTPSMTAKGSPSKRVADPPVVLPHAPLLGNTFTQSPSPSGPAVDREGESPGFQSSGSSDPSVHSAFTAASERSSASSVLPHLGSTVKKDVGQDASDITLNLPTDGFRRNPSPVSSATTPTRSGYDAQTLAKYPQPLAYLILIVCPQPLSLQAITKHVEMTLPKQIPHQITARRDIVECQRLIGGDDAVLFTHIILNLAQAEETMAFVDQVRQSETHAQTRMIVLADTKMRNQVKTLAVDLDLGSLETRMRLQFLHKPTKPSRFASIFDPENQRELSIDRNRNSAEVSVDRQKQVFADMEKDVGHKGYKVLLIEDNPVNQKVLKKFLDKVGMAVETALDGNIGTDMVFARKHEYYSLILVYSQCDLHMPNKDGYQTCKDIRQWEKEEKYKRIPIIALSANVMSDVLEKCMEAGFSNYVTKPVDFRALSKAMTDLLEPPPSSSASSSASPSALLARRSS
ncbi:MAG: hypothetical protein M1817_001943 [Caeruleum heppii]|nr:MAG: hypothetical protein M1817_001943 [Caeruleum heppii]